MNPLETVLAELHALPWSQRCRIRVRREDGTASIQRGSMHALVRPLRNRNVEVVYEQALHQPVREEVPPTAAIPFLLQVLGRERLERVPPP